MSVNGTFREAVLCLHLGPHFPDLKSISEKLATTLGIRNCNLSHTSAGTSNGHQEGGEIGIHGGTDGSVLQGMTASKSPNGTEPFKSPGTEAGECMLECPAVPGLFYFIF